MPVSSASIKPKSAAAGEARDLKTKVEYQETLARVMEQTERATRLVDDLLFISRADAGEGILNPCTVPVNPDIS